MFYSAVVSLDSDGTVSVAVAVVEAVSLAVCSVDEDAGDVCSFFAESFFAAERAAITPVS